MLNRWLGARGTPVPSEALHLDPMKTLVLVGHTDCIRLCVKRLGQRLARQFG